MEVVINMKLDVDGTFYDIVVERKSGNRNTYIRVKKDLTIFVTTNKYTSEHAKLRVTNRYLIQSVSEYLKCY